MSEGLSSDSPALRRLELAAALRKHRRSARLTTLEVTEQLGFSASKLSRIETGNRSVQPSDLDRMCLLYGVPDDERQRLSLLVDESRRSSSWRHIEAFDFDQVEFAELEQAASAIDDYKTSIITSLLQTPAYTWAFLRVLKPQQPSDLIAELVEGRILRQKAIFERPDPPRLHFIVDEAAIRRRVGDGATMRTQLEHLAAQAANRRLTLQVIPFAAGAHPAMDSVFTILSFAHSVRDRVYVDDLQGNTYLTTPRDLERYRVTFARLREIALNTNDSRSLLLETAEFHDSA
ncbi:helix-turn-helix domain-containing protein [Cryptosporangium sp. NPDC048952]|uniref:helix-turn-helix domain-containing protein n=1 Tax=Cryptosporangium sp. NPDC048952 TaxID=3363961 RepID=UPI00371B494E